MQLYKVPTEGPPPFCVCIRLIQVWTLSLNEYYKGVLKKEIKAKTIIGLYVYYVLTNTYSTSMMGGGAKFSKISVDFYRPFLSNVHKWSPRKMEFTKKKKVKKYVRGL